MGFEDRSGTIAPGLRADLVLVAHARGDPHDAVLTATPRGVVAAWVDGRAILLTNALPESLGTGPCVALNGVAPRVCDVLSELGLWPAASS